jgi:hypothetical protein
VIACDACPSLCVKPLPCAVVCDRRLNAEAHAVRIMTVIGTIGHVIGPIDNQAALPLNTQARDSSGRPCVVVSLATPAMRGLLSGGSAGAALYQLGRLPLLSATIAIHRPMGSSSLI